MKNTDKTLIIAYLEKAGEKLSAAKKLLESRYYDDAVSRAYYAVFHTAQALLVTEGVKADTHKGIVTLFGLLFVKTGKLDRDLGKYLANLKDDRETGDYEIFSHLDKETAENAVREAEKFRQAGKTYLKKLGY